jgi:hypothetical protein
MHMAPPGIIARYKHDTRPRWTHRRVVAFDDDWQPLIISDDHLLEPASRYGNYDGITDQHDPDGDPLTALLPAGGWRLEYTDDDGTKWSEPLVGWGLKQTGEVVALVTDDEGQVDHLDYLGGKRRVIHPDADRREG